jgi:hypothetical protein
MAKTSNNPHTVVLKGREITMRDLQATMPNSQALVMHKLLYCITHKQFVIHPNCCDTPFVRMTLQEWADDLEICFINGNKRKISRVTVCMIFKALAEDGLVICRHDHSRVASYAVHEGNLTNRITERTGIKFEEA